jgi:hypothetical protein
MTYAMPLPSVSIALPVYRDSGTLEQALGCIQNQTLLDLDIVMVLNGSDEATRRTAHELARRDPRTRTIELPEANLAAACNTALEAARHDLVARMDADDLCSPQRLGAQAAYMAAHPHIAALGSAWELLDAEDHVIGTVRPPCEPETLRWRLLLGNCIAHGSVMLRREMVLRAGGYSTRCSRAQDYDLWLRLSAAKAVACIPEVLYQHRTRFAGDTGRSSGEQAAIAGPLMLEAWRRLPRAENGAADALQQAIVDAISREQGADSGAIETLLDATPTREGLLAWLWAQWFHPPGPRRVAEICKRSRVREVGIQLRAEGVGSVWLWGAGDHTRWLLGVREELGVQIDGLIDDARAGQTRFGFAVGRPQDLQPGDCAVISSDWHEETIWDRSADVRARGVRIFRLYGT